MSVLFLVIRCVSCVLFVNLFDVLCMMLLLVRLVCVYFFFGWGSSIGVGMNVIGLIFVFVSICS